MLEKHHRLALGRCPDGRRKPELRCRQGGVNGLCLSILASVRFASWIGTCKINGFEPSAYLRDLLTSIAKGHPAKVIAPLMPWAHAQTAITQWGAVAAYLTHDKSDILSWVGFSALYREATSHAN